MRGVKTEVVMRPEAGDVGIFHCGNKLLVGGLHDTRGKHETVLAVNDRTSPITLSSVDISSLQIVLGPRNFLLMCSFLGT